MSARRAALLVALAACGGVAAPLVSSPTPAAPSSSVALAPPSAAPPASSVASAAAAPSFSAAPAASASSTAPPIPLEIGCSRWSRTEHAALCVEDFSSIAHGCHETLVFLGPRASEEFPTVDVPPQCLDEIPPKLGEKAEKVALARLQKGDFQALPPVLLSIETSEPAAASLKKREGAHEATLSRTKTGSVDIPMAGSWDVFRDQVRIRCGGRSVVVVDSKVENPSSTKVQLWEPEDGWLLVGYSVSWALEGDSGGLFQVALVEPKTCKVHRVAATRRR